MREDAGERERAMRVLAGAARRRSVPVARAGIAAEQRAVRRGGERRERRRRSRRHDESRAPFTRLASAAQQPLLPPPHARAIARLVLGMVVAEHVQHAVHDEPQQLLAHAAPCALRVLRATPGAM